jgi:steroid delta-isomerase-like uncharacterized protein
VTPGSNKRTARRVIEAINAHQLGELNELLSERFVTHMPALPPGTDRYAMRALSEAMLTAFPDLHYSVEAEIAQRDEVVYRLRATGTQTGELLGADASGRKAAWEEMHVFRFEADGRIVEHWGLVDTASIMMQLGVMPPIERW